MYNVELYARVRRACMVEGLSVREASRVFSLHRDTVRNRCGVKRRDFDILLWPEGDVAA